MDAIQGSAQASDKLSMLTEQYTDIQAVLQKIRVITRAMKELAPIYGDGNEAHEPLINAMALFSEALGTERNRLYVQAHRLGNEMDTLNARIQNGVYNEQA